MLHTCTLNPEALKGHVGKPEEFLEHHEEFVIEFEDEIGVWIGLKGWQTTLPGEAAHHQRKRKKLHSKTVEGVEKIKEEEKEPGGGMYQTRGLEGKSEDRRRITFLHRLILENVVQSEGKRLKPRGKLERTVIVLPGKHANADFFDFNEDGHAVWNRDWSVDVENKSFVYKKGEKLGAMMNQLQQVKKAFPELCEKTLILQQPAAFRDGIIVAWCMQDLHLRRPYLLMQHDLVGCQATAEVKKLRFMLMQPDAQICGEMTACSQLTDIMIARAVKGIARKQIPEIRRWLKEKARKSG